MKFGVREICEVVLRAKATQQIGNKVFYKNEPVIYFDTLKTSSMEGAATTVYAQGGRGNSRLVAWEGERTVTFTMEDALISPEGFMILSGAGLIEASTDEVIYQHITERVDKSKIVDGKIPISKKPHLPYAEEGASATDGNFAWIMLVKDDEIVSEPYIPIQKTGTGDETEGEYYLSIARHGIYDDEGKNAEGEDVENTYDFDPLSEQDYDSVIVDYYTPRTGNAKQIEITADKFGGNYYLEASTLFRTQDGVDMPAEFIIPNCKIQSNFTFTMASTGDPSTFTFTMDAFPDYTRFDRSKKVLAAIQIIEDNEEEAGGYRLKTAHDRNVGQE